MPIKFQRVNTAHDQSDSIPQEVIDAACKDLALGIMEALISRRSVPSEDSEDWAHQLQRAFELHEASFEPRGDRTAQIYDVLDFFDEEQRGICLADQEFSKANPWSNAIGVVTSKTRRDYFVEFCRENELIACDQTILIMNETPKVNNGRFRVVLTRDKNM
jgi:hypothetical protein